MDAFSELFAKAKRVLEPWGGVVITEQNRDQYYADLRDRGLMRYVSPEELNRRFAELNRPIESIVTFPKVEGKVMTVSEYLAVQKMNVD